MAAHLFQMHQQPVRQPRAACGSLHIVLVGARPAAHRRVSHNAARMGHKVSIAAAQDGEQLGEAIVIQCCTTWAKEDKEGAKANGDGKKGLKGLLVGGRCELKRPAAEKYTSPGQGPSSFNELDP